MWNIKDTDVGYRTLVRMSSNRAAVHEEGRTLEESLGKLRLEEGIINSAVTRLLDTDDTSSRDIKSSNTVKDNLRLHPWRRQAWRRQWEDGMKAHWMDESYPPRTTLRNWRRWVIPNSTSLIRSRLNSLWNWCSNHNRWNTNICNIILSNIIKHSLIIVESDTAQNRDRLKKHYKKTPQNVCEKSLLYCKWRWIGGGGSIIPPPLAGT